EVGMLGAQVLCDGVRRVVPHLPRDNDARPAALADEDVSHSPSGVAGSEKAVLQPPPWAEVTATLSARRVSATTSTTAPNSLSGTPPAVTYITKQVLSLSDFHSPPRDSEWRSSR